MGARKAFHQAEPDDPDRSSGRRAVWVVLGLLVAILSLFLAGEIVGRFVTYRAVRSQTLAAQKPVSADEVLRHTFYNFVHRFPRPGEEARLLQSGLPVYDLRISPRNLERMRRTAEAVMAVDLSTGIPREYVPARFLMDGDWVDVDVKLRGLTGVHYWRARPSLRVKFPKNRLFRGMRQINISTPMDKGLTKDLVTNWELSRHGLMTWQSRFVILRINGEVVGLFQEIEQFGRSLVDREGRTEGFIFSGAGQLFGQEGGFGWTAASAAIDGFEQCLQQAHAPAEAGPCNRQFAEDFLEPELIAWAGAASSLLGSLHAWDPDNLRLYFDPARGRLEPIPWDYNSNPINPYASPEGEPAADGFGRALFRIPELRRQRDRFLWTLVTQRVEPMIAHSDRLFDGIAEPLAHNKRRPGVAEKDRAEHGKNTDVLRSNAVFLRDRLQRRQLHATVYRGEQSIVVDVSNPAKAFAVVLAVVLETDGYEEVVELRPPQAVDGTWFGVPGSSRVVPGVAVPSETSLVGLIAKNGVTGETFEPNEIQISERTGTPPPDGFGSRSRGQEPRLELPPGFHRRARVIRVGPGRVRLRSSLVFGRDETVVLAPGTTLSLTPGASLIVEGNLIGLGSRRQPIRITGSDPDRGWGAIAVQGTRQRPSRVDLEWVTITGGMGAQGPRALFTGAFSVTDGVVRLRSCRFEDARADDGINLRYCSLDIRDSTIAGSRDDGVDLDFCSGVVEGNNINDTGGDGLDLSGSFLVVAHNTIEGCGDKGVSAGERSFVELRGSSISACQMGVAAKDAARLEAVDCNLSHLEIGLAAYQKKLTFGPPRVHMREVVMVDVAAPVHEAPGARLWVGAHSGR